MDDIQTRVTHILAEIDAEAGSIEDSAEELFSLVYDELKRVARGLMRRERPGHTLQPTALVHEAYAKLVDSSRVQWRGRTHFLSVGARVMRRVLVEHARAHGREKRGAGWRRVTLAESVLPGLDSNLDPEDLLWLNAALEKLDRADERQARVVELRFFGGFTVSEVAEALGVSKRTVEGDWTHARAWLRRELHRRETP